MIVHRHGRAERGHHAVTQVVDERAAVVEDRVGHQPQVPVEHLDHLIDGERLRERREPAEVSEEDGPGQRLGRDRGSAVGAVEQRADDRLRHEPGEDAPHALLFQVVQQLAVQPRVHPRAQDHRIERLGQEVLGAHLDAPDHALGVVDAADHDHRQMAQRVVALDALEHLDAVHARHDQVQQDDVGWVFGEHGERGGAVTGRGRPMPLVFEGGGEESTVQRVVVDHQDVAHAPTASSGQRESFTHAHGPQRLRER